VKQGGTGSAKDLERHPEVWPLAFEAGTPNTPAIFGLAAALDWLEQRGDADGHRRKSVAAVDTLRTALGESFGTKINFQSPESGGRRLPILSFTMTDLDPAEAGIVLAGAGVHVRTGFHCAPWIHAFIGTDAAGSVRVSPGPFVSEDELLRVASALTR
jgi:selenocysteine lyase/cysteine desulfurase